MSPLYTRYEFHSIGVDGLFRSTRHGEHKVRSQGARDRRALTGEAGNASRRQVIVGDAGMNPMRDECASDAGRSRPNNSRVMRTNFGDMTAEIFREHSDSLEEIY